jgi:hypothetical protein
VREVEMRRLGKHGSIADRCGNVPPDMRERRSLRHEPAHVPADDGETAFAGGLVAVFEEDLKPETDPEIRAVRTHALGEDVPHASFHRAGEGAERALTRNDDDVRATHGIGLALEADLGSDAAGRPLDGAKNAPHISESAGAHDDDAHRVKAIARPPHPVLSEAMPSSLGKKIFGAGAMLGLLALLTSSCGAAQGAMGAASDVTGGAVGAKCPDLTKVESIMAFDFAQNFKIDAAAGAKLKAGTAAAVELKGFADQIDADLKLACGNIAKDLGQAGDAKDGKAACDLAIKGITDVKAKLGGNAKIALAIKEPKCQADMKAYADCAGNCDVKAKGPSAKVECEPGKLSGKCDASCSGTCDVQAGAKCEGTCSGSCDAEVKGSCSGKCDGKCDGKTSSGASCAGNCEGKCQGGTFKGECKGKCGGSCELKAEAKCEGTCTGKCSAEFKEPKCTGEVKPPEMSADCKAHCDTNVSAKMECTPAQVGLAITGAGDAQLAAKLQATVEKNFPLVIKVAIGMGERAAKVAANAQAVVEGIQGSIETIAKSSGDATKATMIGGQITACLGETFKGALSAAGSLKANVKVSVDVKASASASAGGSAKGGTGVEQ